MPFLPIVSAATTYLNKISVAPTTQQTPPAESANLPLPQASTYPSKALDNAILLKFNLRAAFSVL